MVANRGIHRKLNQKWATRGTLNNEIINGQTEEDIAMKLTQIRFQKSFQKRFQENKLNC